MQVSKCNNLGFSDPAFDHSSKETAHTSQDNFDVSGLANIESSPSKSDTLRRYAFQPALVLTAVFVVHFIGHPRSGSEFVIFLKNDIEDLFVQLRSHFDLPEGVIPKVGLEGNQDSCTFSDICAAAKRSNQLVSPTQITDQSLLSFPTGDPRSFDDVQDSKLPLLQIRLTLTNALLIRVVAIPYHLCSTSEILKFADGAAEIKFINPLESLERVMNALKKGIAVPEDYPLLDSSLLTVNGILITRTFLIRNGDLLCIKCFPKEDVDLLTQFKGDSADELEIPSIAISRDASYLAPNSIENDSVVAQFGKGSSFDTEQDMLSSELAVASSGPELSFFCRVKNALNDFGISLSQHQIENLCNNADTIEDVINRYLAQDDNNNQQSEQQQDDAISDFCRDLDARLQSIGIRLDQASLKRLSLTSSSIDGAQDYYLNNQELFKLQKDMESSDTKEIQTAAKCTYEAAPSAPSELAELPSLYGSIRNKFAEMGVALSHSSIRRLSLTSSSLDGAVLYYFNNINLFSDDNDNRSPAPTEEVVIEKDCIICQDSYPVSELFCVECSLSHRYCFGCLSTHIRLAIIGDDETQPHLPACPLANSGGVDSRCNYLLSEGEIKQIVKIAIEAEVLSMSVGSAIIHGAQRLYLSKGYRDNNCIRCVGCSGDEDNSFWFQVEGSQQTVCCPRPECRTEFCTKCRRTPSHYACECDEVMTLSRAWLEWTTRGRNEYIDAVSARNMELAAEREKAIAAHSAEVAAAEARFQEMVQNEQYKAGHCKYCPSCRRVVEKLDGCDLMICGQNYHGGDVQNGCGARFRWSEAAAYQPDTGDKKTVGELTNLPPTEAMQIRHKILDSIDMICDRCENPLVGPRINCINCPSVNLCLMCSLQPESRTYSGSASRGHDISHICRVIMSSDV